jgi:organic radical activating enzyme
MEIIMNEQKPEKKNHRPDGILEVHSIFYTIQGEGPFAGERAVFIRLAGCNLMCKFCDTDYTSTRYPMHPETIRSLVEEQAKPSEGHLVVITGGEPMRQNLGPLLELLSGAYRIQIETNGTIYQDVPYGVTVICSPKTNMLAHNMAGRVDVFKYVLDRTSLSKKDGLPLTALGHSAKRGLARPPFFFPNEDIYLQPIDVQDVEENKKHLAAVAKSVMDHGYKLGVQLHKLLEME